MAAPPLARVPYPPPVKKSPSAVPSRWSWSPPSAKRVPSQDTPTFAEDTGVVGSRVHQGPETRVTKRDGYASRTATTPWAAFSLATAASPSGAGSAFQSDAAHGQPQEGREPTQLRWRPDAEATD